MSSDAWYYCDAAGVWQGPVPWAQLLAWHDAGYLAPQLALLHGGRVVRLAETRAARAVVDAVPGESGEAAAQWLYRAPDGSEQGPFAHSQMLAWVRAGALPDATRVRRADESGTRALSNVFEFADARRLRAAEATAGVGAGASDGAAAARAHFDQRGRFRASGALDPLARQGLSRDREFNQLARHFDVDAYQDAMRRADAAAADAGAQLRFNKARYKKAKATGESAAIGRKKRDEQRKREREQEAYR